MSSNDPQNTPSVLATTPEGEATSFISSAWAGKSDNSVYGDFFQETSDGKITVGSKAQKSGLETATTILGYIVPVIVVIALIATIHVFLRSQESGKLIENYSFLCTHLNYGTSLESSERGCKSLTAIATEYNQKREMLEGEILVKLNEYIPLKISQNILKTSPERAFIIDTYANKLHVDDVIARFEDIVKNSTSISSNNIQCNGISITGAGKIMSQCTVYGGPIGADDTNGKMGSARIEALRFIENLGATNTSGFILLNPPSSLSIEKTDATNPNFQTRTTISVQAQYVSFTNKP